MTGQEFPLHSAEAHLNAERMIQAGEPLLRHFDIQVDPRIAPFNFLDAIKKVDPRFQTEESLERWQLEKDDTNWPDDTKALIMQAAGEMRMLEPETPLVGYFDAVIVLGAARQANLDRARYAADAALFRHGEQKASYKQLIVAGSTRPLSPQEQENTANYAPGAVTEFDLCVGAAKVIAQENPGLIAGVLQVNHPKAGNPEIIGRVLETLRSTHAIKEDSAVAAVTTQIYQAATELDMARTAKRYGINHTYTAGNPSDPKIVEARTHSTYLSEVLRTLRAAAYVMAEPPEQA